MNESSMFGGWILRGRDKGDCDVELGLLEPTWLTTAIMFV
jgi:hypothetical protein